MAAAVDPHQYLKEAECLFSEQEVAVAIETLVSSLNADYKDDCPLLLSVMTGAVFVTGQLMPHLTFPLDLDYIHASRYQKGVVGKDVEWIVKPRVEMRNRSVLVLDDILDEGVTLKVIVDACYSLGAKRVKTAVLVDKELGKSKPIKADYIGLTVPDRYVFGCGMDVYGWWRNLPAIYALTTT